MTKSFRKEFLEKVEKIVSGERQETYGDPTFNFRVAADMINAFLKGKMEAASDPRSNTEKEIQPHDVCVIVALLKMARLAWDPTHEDSWLDIAGYAACGFEVASPSSQKDSSGTTRPVPTIKEQNGIYSIESSIPTETREEDPPVCFRDWPGRFLVRGGEQIHDGVSFFLTNEGELYNPETNRFHKISPSGRPIYPEGHPSLMINKKG